MNIYTNFLIYIYIYTFTNFIMKTSIEAEAQMISIHLEIFFYCCRIMEADVNNALTKMRIKKLVGHDDIPIKTWKCVRKI